MTPHTGAGQSASVECGRVGAHRPGWWVSTGVPIPLPGSPLCVAETGDHEPDRDEPAQRQTQHGRDAAG